MEINYFNTIIVRRIYCKYILKEFHFLHLSFFCKFKKHYLNDYLLIDWRMGFIKVFIVIFKKT